MKTPRRWLQRSKKASIILFFASSALLAAFIRFQRWQLGVVTVLALLGFLAEVTTFVRLRKMIADEEKGETPGSGRLR